MATGATPPTVSSSSPRTSTSTSTTTSSMNGSDYDGARTWCYDVAGSDAVDAEEEYFPSMLSRKDEGEEATTTPHMCIGDNSLSQPSSAHCSVKCAADVEGEYLPNESEQTCTDGDSLSQQSFSDAARASPITSMRTSEGAMSTPTAFMDSASVLDKPCDAGKPSDFHPDAHLASMEAPSNAEPMNYSATAASNSLTDVGSCEGLRSLSTLRWTKRNLHRAVPG